MAITLGQIQNALDNWWQNLDHRPRLGHLMAVVAGRWLQVDPASVGWLRPVGLVSGTDGFGTVIKIQVEQANHTINNLELRPTPGLRADGLTLDNIEWLGGTNAPNDVLALPDGIPGTPKGS